MRPTFGLVVPQGWKLDLRAVADPRAKWDRMREAAVVAEAAGFDSIWLYDHLLTYPTVEVETTFECWTSLAALARETRRVRIGTLVICNSYRQPSLLAKMAATVDVISGGRLEFGIGAGWYEREYIAFGYDFPPPSRRLRMLDEAVQVIRKLWTEEHVTFQGRHYRLWDAICEPKPLQRPHPPITIGGGGERVTLEIAARWADKCNVSFLPPERVAAKYDILRSHCNRVGRPYDTVRKTVQLNAVLSPTEAQVDALIERYRHVVAAEVYRAHSIIGTARQCRERLGEYVAVGVEEFMFYMPQAVDSEIITRFADEILAAF